ncbi:MAG: STAS/SEC14 domain-containing protein [Mycobacterium sp.]
MPAGIQGVEAAGTVTAMDYERVLVPLGDQARRTGGRMRFLYQFGPDFRRITIGALWADARLGMGYARLLDGCAVVSDIEWIRKLARIFGAWMPCPVQVFHNADLGVAATWLNSLPGAADVSNGT